MKAIALASLPIALAFLLAGCGSNKNSAGAASQASRSGQPTRPNQQAFARFQQCLKDGVTLPSGRPQGQPGQRPTFDSKTQKAFQACRQYLPSRPQGGFGGHGFNGPST